MDRGTIVCVEVDDPVLFLPTVAKQRIKCAWPLVHTAATVRIAYQLKGNAEAIVFLLPTLRCHGHFAIWIMRDGFTRRGELSIIPQHYEAVVTLVEELTATCKLLSQFVEEGKVIEISVTQTVEPKILS